MLSEPPLPTDDETNDNPRSSGILMRCPVRVLLALEPSRRATTIAHGLSERGYVVIPADNGNEVVTELAACTIEGRPRPDVLVASTALSGWSGLELLEGLVGSEWELPVILVRSERERGVTGMEQICGAHATLGPELRLAALYDAIDDAVAPVLWEWSGRASA